MMVGIRFFFFASVLGIVFPMCCVEHNIFDSSNLRSLRSKFNHRPVD